MSMLTRFDLSTDFTQFFFVGLMLLMTLVVLLTWVAPKAKDRKRAKNEKADDRYAGFHGELID